jgi:hypothetical protein
VKRVKDIIVFYPFSFSTSPFKKAQGTGQKQKRRMTEVRNEDTPVVSECSGPDCPKCAKAAEDAAQSAEMGFAFLLAMLPVISLTLFGQAGLL